ncbi:MAG: TolC family protein [Draconibacterium sp.]
MFGKQKLILLLTAVLLAVSSTVFSQETLRLSKQDALKMATQFNTEILNSELDLQIAQKKIWETTASGLPQFSAKGNYQHTFKVPTVSFGGGMELSDQNIPFDPTTMTGTTSSVTLQNGESIYLNATPGAEIELGVPNYTTFDFTVSQLIFSGAYIVGLQASKVYYNFSANNAEKTKLDVIESVANTYNVIQLAEESEKILKQNLENINKTLYEINEMNKQGFVEKTDVDQLELSANTVRNAINQVESNLGITYRLLKIQLGIDESTEVKVTDPLESGDSLNITIAALANQPFVLEQNVDYKLIQVSEKSAELQLNLAKSNFLPTISAFYNHTEKINKPAFDFAPKDIIGVSLNIPIFSSGQRLSIVSQRKMDLEKAVNTRKFVSESLLMQATQYQSDLKVKLENYKNQQKSKQLADEIYQRTLEKYKQGLATSLDLMNSQNQYLTNLTNYYQSIYDLQSSKTKLEKLFNINQIQQ